MYVCACGRNEHLCSTPVWSRAATWRPSLGTKQESRRACNCFSNSRVVIFTGVFLLCLPVPSTAIRFLWMNHLEQAEEWGGQEKALLWQEHGNFLVYGASVQGSAGDTCRARQDGMSRLAGGVGQVGRQGQEWGGSCLVKLGGGMQVRILEILARTLSWELETPERAHCPCSASPPSLLLACSALGCAKSSPPPSNVAGMLCTRLCQDLPAHSHYHELRKVFAGGTGMKTTYLAAKGWMRCDSVYGAYTLHIFFER